MPPRRLSRKPTIDTSATQDSIDGSQSVPPVDAPRKSARQAAAAAKKAATVKLSETSTPTVPRKRAPKKNTATSDAPVSSTSPSVPALKPTPSQDVIVSKPGAKRDRSESDDESTKNLQPASKKVKKSAEKSEDGKDTDKDAVNDSKKMVTILKRGAAPVDPRSPYVSTHQVYVSPDGEVWDAMLNQTNIGMNANKFYVIQLLHPIGNDSACTLYVRWGRTGENGASQSKGPWSAQTAVKEFKKQFRTKTGTPWEGRKGMPAKSGKYTWLERDFNNENEETDSPPKSKAKASEKPVSEKIPESTLPNEVQSLCRLIFNMSFIDAALSAMNYDANKLPLGKLSKATILKGFAALKSLSEVIEDPTGAAQLGGFEKACMDLSGQYYSIIPHVFGRSKPTVISTMHQLKKELELVDALGDMEIAQKLIEEKGDKDEHINPLDARFRSLDLESIQPINPESKEFTALAAYARNTHGATHSHYKVSIQTAFRVRRKFESDNWIKAGYDSMDGHRMLLWHGSRSTNFAGILSQGLRIAPPEAPVNGYMFGKGVYFADMMSKSYNYCYAQTSGNIGILLLCEVAARPHHELLDSDYQAEEGCKKAGKLATKGIGKTQPVDWQDAGEALDNEELKGCLMPKGEAQDVNPANAHLMYNEYIVYNTAQIKVKYLLMVRMQH